MIVPNILFLLIVYVSVCEYGAKDRQAVGQTLCQQPNEDLIIILVHYN